MINLLITLTATPDCKPGQVYTHVVGHNVGEATPDEVHSAEAIVNFVRTHGQVVKDFSYSKDPPVKDSPDAQVEGLWKEFRPRR